MSAHTPEDRLFDADDYSESQSHVQESPDDRPDLDRDYWNHSEVPFKENAPESALDFKRPVLEIGQVAVRNLMPREGMSERNRFLRKYRWIPYSKHEVTMADRGMAVQVQRILSKGPNSLSAIKKDLNAMDRYQAQSRISLETLSEVVDPGSDEHLPLAGAISRSHTVKEVLARYLFARESFDEFKWYPAKSGRTDRRNPVTDRRLQQLVGYINSVDEEAQVSLWQMAVISNRQRLKFWSGQAESIKDNDRVREARSLAA